METGIYAITNTVTGKSYVGSAVNIRTRFAVHRNQLNAHRHCNPKLQNSWNKHGLYAFEFRVLEHCEKTVLAEREQHWMDALDAVTCGYNVYPFARTSVGHRVSVETRMKIADKRRGMRASNETRELLSRIQSGRKKNPTEVEKRATAMRGKRHSDETKLKLRTIALARPVDWVKIRKMHAALEGREQTPEHIAKRVAYHLGAKRSEEARRNMAAAQKRRFSKSTPQESPSIS